MFLRKSQKNAIESFEEHFYKYKNKKGILAACCGFGKTLVAFKIIEKCIVEKNESKFIIITSRIKLVDQLLKNKNDYIPNININLVVLCSEKKSIDVEQILTNNTEKNKKPLLIIATYNSSFKIANIFKNIQPNLIIFDEAHNTICNNNINKFHNYLLEKKEFNCEKYLFMTASPIQLMYNNQQYSQYSKIKNISNIPVHSMNNFKTYGKIFYYYSFNQGFQDNIICKFKTIYLESNYTSENFNKNFLIHIHNWTKSTKQFYYYATICKFALDSIGKYNLKRLLVYLPNQNKVNIFESLLKMIIKKQKKNIEIYSILSHHNKTKRKKTENNFKNDSLNTKTKKILLSVGIYNEGVDIPIIDSILFAEERTNPTTIIQNIGRCLRKYPNKQYAYVLIPICLYKYNTINGDVQQFSSRYKKIRNIIDLMKISNNTKPFYTKYQKNNNKKTIKNCESNYKQQNNNCVNNLQYFEKYFIKIEKMANTLKFTTTTNNNINTPIANINYDKFKSLVRFHGITSLQEYKEFIKKNNFLCKYPHIEFNKEWISYGDFFGIGTLSYNECKIFLCKFIHKSTRNEINNFDKFKYFIYKCWSNDKFNNNLNLCKIPSNPQKYYENKWINWQDFLSVNSSSITDNNYTNNNQENQENQINQLTIEEENENLICTTNEEISTGNVNNNLTNLFNSDFLKIQKLGSFIEYPSLQIESLINLKHLLQNKFNVKLNFSGRIRKKYYNNIHEYINCFIWCQRPEDIHNYKIIIIVYPNEYKICYDNDIENKQLLNTKTRYERRKQFSLRNYPKIINELNNFIVNCKAYISNLNHYQSFLYD